MDRPAKPASENCLRLADRPGHPSPLGRTDLRAGGSGRRQAASTSCQAASHSGHDAYLSSGCRGAMG